MIAILNVFLNYNVVYTKSYKRFIPRFPLMHECYPALKSFSAKRHESVFGDTQFDLCICNDNKNDPYYLLHDLINRMATDNTV